MANKLILIVGLPPSRSESRLFATDPLQSFAELERVTALQR